VFVNKVVAELVVACRIEEGWEIADTADFGLHIVVLEQVERHLGGGSSGSRTLVGTQAMVHQQ